MFLYALLNYLQVKITLGHQAVREVEVMTSCGENKQAVGEVINLAH